MFSISGNNWIRGIIIPSNSIESAFFKIISFVTWTNSNFTPDWHKILELSFFLLHKFTRILLISAYGPKSKVFLWSIIANLLNKKSSDHFIKHKPLISEECVSITWNFVYNLLARPHGTKLCRIGMLTAQLVDKVYVRSLSKTTRWLLTRLINFKIIVSCFSFGFSILFFLRLNWNLNSDFWLFDSTPKDHSTTNRCSWNGPSTPLPPAR